jgi:hypothetical protein
LTIDTIVDRVSSICAGAPFHFTAAATPFDFNQEPTGVMEGCFRVLSASQSIIGGFNYREERTDQIQIWVARSHHGDPVATLRRLLTDVSSLRSAVIHDDGDFFVPIGGQGWGVEQQAGQAFAMLRFSIPVNYEVTV